MEAVRGVRQFERGDLCGHRAVSATAAAKERQSVIDHSVRTTQDKDVPLSIVDVPGGSSPFALPTFVLDAIKRAAR